jgi:rubredoxin---NAD+ reductase
MSNSIVIVGSGLAGYAVLQELRRFDTTTPVTVLTADDGAAYSKGALSDGLAHNRNAADLIVATAEQMAFRYHARLLPFTRADSIDRQERVVVTKQGPIPWRRLVLATGAEAIQPRLRGSGAERVLTVASLADYAYLKAELVGRRRVTLLGGALWGCEFAEALARAGCEVSLFEASSRLFAGVLPGLCAERLARALEAARVRIHLENGVQRVEREVGGLKVFPFAGEPFLADLVLATLGSRPRVDLARDAGLAVGRGIQVDKDLKSSDPHIFAVGECAEVQGRVLSLPADIEAAARSLGAALGGRHSVLQWQPRIQSLSLPRCPVILCEPSRGVEGEWHERADRGGVQALFTDARGALRGFALLGKAVADKERLMAALLSGV